jgi:hypothetical protein
MKNYFFPLAPCLHPSQNAYYRFNIFCNLCNLRPLPVHTITKSTLLNLILAVQNVDNYT